MIGKAKGVLFVHLENFSKLHAGPTAYRAAIDRLSAEDKDAVSGLVLALGWYPIGAWNRLLDGYLRARYPNPRDGMDKFSTYLGEQELRGLVKFVLKLGSPEFMLKRTDFLWSRYFDQGKFAAEQIGAREFHLTLEGPVDENLGPSRYNCAQGAAPWLTRGLHLAGYPDGRVDHYRCRHDGAPRCEFRATW